VRLSLDCLKPQAVRQRAGRQSQGFIYRRCRRRAPAKGPGGVEVAGTKGEGAGWPGKDVCFDVLQ
jgi:hypothetical protein